MEFRWISSEEKFPDIDLARGRSEYVLARTDNGKNIMVCRAIVFGSTWVAGQPRSPEKIAWVGAYGGEVLEDQESISYWASVPEPAGNPLAWSGEAGSVVEARAYCSKCLEEVGTPHFFSMAAQSHCRRCGRMCLGYLVSKETRAAGA